MINRSKIGLGTVQFGMSYGVSNKSGKTSPAEVKNILEMAKQQGIKVLDSASVYGDAEKVLGKNDLQEFKIVSKFIPPVPGDAIRTQFYQSLKKLNVNNLYGYLAHRPLELIDHPEQWEELSDLKEKGEVDKIGFSLNDPEELPKLLDKGFEPDLVQVPYSYFDRRFENDIMTLKGKGCEIHTRSAFLQGLFFLNPDKLDAFFDQIKPILSELQKGKEMLPGQLIKFVIEKPFIDKAIIGIETRQQLSENLRSVEIAPALPELEEPIPEEILIPLKWPIN